ILRTPKGWTGPKEVDGKKVEDSWRSHQVPFSDMATGEGRVQLLEQWLKSYRPEELFDENGRLLQQLRELAPTGDRRMSANPRTNGGLVRRDLRMPDFRDYAIEVPAPGSVTAEAMTPLGKFFRDIMKLNLEARNFRLFAPDELASNRLSAVFEVTERSWHGET